MAFIEESDLLVYITQRDLDQITEEDPVVIDESIKDSLEYAAEMLRHRFDMIAEFAKVAPNRNRQLLKQTIAVAIFYINERIPTDILPESREMAFERANDWLKEVQEGKRQTTLTPIDEEAGTGHNISYGSHPRNNDNFI